MKAKKEKELSNENKIEAYIHCGLCIGEIPDGVSPREFQRIQAGWTVQGGLQIWCTRHNCNVMHIDFQGVKHPANTTRRERRVCLKK